MSLSFEQCVLIASLVAVNKILTGSNLREEGFAWLLV